MSGVMCHVSSVTFFFSFGGASQRRVCYQGGLPRLVFLLFQAFWLLPTPYQVHEAPAPLGEAAAGGGAGGGQPNQVGGGDREEMEREGKTGLTFACIQDQRELQPVQGEWRDEAGAGS